MEQTRERLFEKCINDLNLTSVLTKKVDYELFLKNCIRMCEHVILSATHPPLNSHGFKVS